MQIVALDGYTLNPGDNPWDEIRTLGELIVHDRTPVEQTVARAKDADVIVTNKAPITADMIAQLPKLKLIAVTATGYNIIDTAAARQRGIVVSNVPEYGSDTVAQYTFALLLELCHHVGLHSDSVFAGEWQNHKDFGYWKTPLTDLAGKTIGIVGFGRIGRRVGEIAHAFGMNVLAPARKNLQRPSYERFEAVEMNQLFARSDVVTLHCPLTSENQGMINRALLSTMKRSAFLINTARGALVVEQDLADALNKGTIAGAAVDVVSAEPIKADNPLLTAKNLIITPHIAWATLEARQRLMKTTTDNIRAFAAGKPIHVVNP